MALMSFKDFINEKSSVGKDVGHYTNLAYRFLNSIPGRNYKEFGRIIVKKYGKSGVIQNIYVETSTAQGVGVNFASDGRFLGISVWDTFRGADSTPDMECEASRAEVDNKEWFVKYLSRVTRIIAGGTNDEMDELDESLNIVNEAAPVFSYGGNTYRGLMPLVQAMYDDGEDLTSATEQIQQIYGNSSKDGFVRVAYGMLDDGAVGLKAGDVYAELEGNRKLKRNSIVKVVGGIPQKEEASEDETEAEEVFMKTKFADPKVVYKHLEALTKSVAEGTTTALLITGKGGTGKSFTVDKVLNEYASGEWVKMKGKASPKGMYRYLYNHYSQIVVFDDCDSVFSDKDGINVLKGALDTGDNRVIGWVNDDPACVRTEGMNHDEIELALAEFSEQNHSKQGFPSEFVFEGQVIFISNLTLEQIRKRDSALLTRCEVLDVTLDSKGLVSRMETILPSIRYFAARCVNGQKVELTNEKDKLEVLEYLKTDEAQRSLRAKGEEFSIRTIIKACKLKHSLPDMWKELL